MKSYTLSNWDGSQTGGSSSGSQEMGSLSLSSSSSSHSNTNMTTAATANNAAATTTATPNTVSSGNHTTSHSLNQALGVSVHSTTGFSTNAITTNMNLNATTGGRLLSDEGSDMDISDSEIEIEEEKESRGVWNDASGSSINGDLNIVVDPTQVMSMNMRVDNSLSSSSTGLSMTVSRPPISESQPLLKSPSHLLSSTTTPTLTSPLHPTSPIHKPMPTPRLTPRTSHNPTPIHAPLQTSTLTLPMSMPTGIQLQPPTQAAFPPLTFHPELNSPLHVKHLPVQPLSITGTPAAKTTEGGLSLSTAVALLSAPASGVASSSRPTLTATATSTPMVPSAPALKPLIPTTRVSISSSHPDELPQIVSTGREEAQKGMEKGKGKERPMFEFVIRSEPSSSQVRGNTGSSVEKGKEREKEKERKVSTLQPSSSSQTQPDPAPLKPKPRPKPKAVLARITIGPPPPVVAASSSKTGPPTASSSKTGDSAVSSSKGVPSTSKPSQVNSSGPTTNAVKASSVAVGSGDASSMVGWSEESSWSKESNFVPVWKKLPTTIIPGSLISFGSRPGTSQPSKAMPSSAKLSKSIPSSSKASQSTPSSSKVSMSTPAPSKPSASSKTPMSTPSSRPVSRLELEGRAKSRMAESRPVSRIGDSRNARGSESRPTSRVGESRPTPRAESGPTSGIGDSRSTSRIGESRSASQASKPVTYSSSSKSASKPPAKPPLSAAAKPPPAVAQTLAPLRSKPPPQSSVSKPATSTAKPAPVATPPPPNNVSTPSPHSSPLFTPNSTPKHPGDEDISKLFTPKGTPEVEEREVLEVSSSSEIVIRGPGREELELTSSSESGDEVAKLLGLGSGVPQTSGSVSKRKHLYSQSVSVTRPPNSKSNLVSTSKQTRKPKPMSKSKPTSKPKSNLAYISIPLLTRPKYEYVQYDREAKLVAKMRSLGIAVETRKLAEEGAFEMDGVLWGGVDWVGWGSDRNAIAGGEVGKAKKAKAGGKDGKKRKRDEDAWWDDSGIGGSKSVGGKKNKNVDADAESLRKIQKMEDRSKSKSKIREREEDEDVSQSQSHYPSKPKSKSTTTSRSAIKPPSSQSNQKAKEVIDEVIDLTMEDGDDDNVSRPMIADSWAKVQTVLKDKANSESVVRGGAKLGDNTSTSTSAVSKPKSTVPAVGAQIGPSRAGTGTSSNNVDSGMKRAAKGMNAMLPPPPPPPSSSRPKPRPAYKSIMSDDGTYRRMTISQSKPHDQPQYYSPRTSSSTPAQVAKARVDDPISVDEEDNMSMREPSPFSDISDVALVTSKLAHSSAAASYMAPSTPPPPTHHTKSGSLFGSPSSDSGVELDAHQPTASTLLSAYTPPATASKKAKRDDMVDEDREVKRRKHGHDDVTPNSNIKPKAKSTTSDPKEKLKTKEHKPKTKVKIKSSIWASSVVPITSKRGANHLCLGMTRLNLCFEFPVGSAAVDGKRIEKEKDGGKAVGNDTMKCVYWRPRKSFFDLKRGVEEDMEENMEDSESDEEDDEGEVEEGDQDAPFEGVRRDVKLRFSRGITVARGKETRIPIGEEWDEVVVPLQNHSIVYSSKHGGMDDSMTPPVSRSAPSLSPNRAISSSKYYRAHTFIDTSTIDAVPPSSSSIKKRKHDQVTSSSTQSQTHSIVDIYQTSAPFATVNPTAIAGSSSNVVNGSESVVEPYPESPSSWAPEIESASLSEKALGKRKADSNPINITATTSGTSNAAAEALLSSSLALNPVAALDAYNTLFGPPPISVDATLKATRQNSLMSTPSKDKSLEVFFHHFTDMSPEKPYGIDREDDASGGGGDPDATLIGLTAATATSVSGSTRLSTHTTTTPTEYRPETMPDVSNDLFSDVVGSGGDSLLDFQSEIDLDSQLWDMYGIDPVERVGEGVTTPAIAGPALGDGRFTTIDPTLLGGGASAQEVLEAGLDAVDKIGEWDPGLDDTMDEVPEEEQDQDEADDEKDDSESDNSDTDSEEESEDEEVKERSDKEDMSAAPEDSGVTQAPIQANANRTPAEVREKAASDITPVEVSRLPSPLPPINFSPRPSPSSDSDYVAEKGNQPRKSTRQRKDSTRKREATSSAPSVPPRSSKPVGVVLSEMELDFETRLASYEDRTHGTDKLNNPGEDRVYCHQCRRPVNIVMIACNTCVKKFCIRCLAMRYLALEFDCSSGIFKCPACHGFCNCTACVRKRQEEYKSGIINEAPLLFDNMSDTSTPPPPDITDFDLTVPAAAETEFWGALYDLNGEKIGTAVVSQKHVASGYIPVVYAHAFPGANLSEPATKRRQTKPLPVHSNTTRVFVGIPQRCWGLASNPKTKVINRIPRVKKGVHSYVGNRKLLKYRVIPSQLGDMSDLSPLPSSDEDEEEDGSPSKDDVILPETAPISPISPDTPLEDIDVARAITMALEACGHFTKFDDRNNVFSV